MRSRWRLGLVVACDVPTGLPATESKYLFAKISASGTLCRASGCGLELPPFPTVTLKNEIELLVRLGGEG